MGKLKPIGSEKLEGAEKIKRMIEIARYKENIPQPINENERVDYRITLSDGKKYLITKEKVGYVIKKSINESRDEFDYIEPMRNRKHYSSYSEAFKRLNIIAKEINSLTGNKNNISLFTESDSSEKRYLLKMKEQAPTPEEQPVPTDQAATVPATPEAAPQPMDTPMPEDETMPDGEMDAMSEEDTVTFKSIQKLTGKLGQKIRQFLSNEENQMTSKDIKYVINSVLSAFDLNSLDEEDKDEITSKFEVDTDGGYDLGDEMSSEPPSEPTDETGEMSKPETEEMPEPETAEGYRHRFKDLTDEESDKVSEMIEGLFSESKVDSILKKYFKIGDKEKKIMESKRKNLVESKIKRKKLSDYISKISESIFQEISSKRFLLENKDAIFIGKSQLNNLIFEVDKKRYKINTKGDII